jgi:hypothetical protein
MNNQLIEFITDDWEIDQVKGSIFSDEEFVTFLEENNYDAETCSIKIILEVVAK